MGSPSYTLVNLDEADAVVPLTAPERLRFNVFTIDGQSVLGNAKSLDGLAKGLYIVNGKRQYIK